MLIAVVLALSAPSGASVNAQNIGVTQVQGRPTTVDWSSFWRIFNNIATWDLQYHDGTSWVSMKQLLQVIRTYPQPYTMKFTLNFTSQDAGPYRLYLLVDQEARNYTAKLGENRYALEYGEYAMIYDWNDMVNIPNLQVQHGVVAEKFYFMIRHDNVPANYNLLIDPLFEAEEYNPAKDTYVYEFNPSTPYGSSTDLIVDTEFNKVKRTFLEFDLSPISSACTIINASLKLYFHDYYHVPSAEHQYRIHRTNSSWSESVTWNTQPSVSDPHVNNTIGTTTGWWITNVTDIVTLGEDNGFRIHDSHGTTSEWWSKFYSKEYGDSDYHPVLEVWFEYNYKYVLDGGYYEDGDDAGSVCVDVHYENISQRHFTVDGLTASYHDEEPLFFSWPVNSYLRVYYPPNNDTYKVFIPEAPYYAYAFTFRDYPGIIDDSAYLESHRTIENEPYLIERRNIKDNVGNTVPLIMEQGASYLLVLNTSQVEYRFGYFLAASVLEKDLILSYIDFPSNIKMAYPYVRMDATRTEDNTVITVNYEDTLEETNTVDLYITYRNNSIVYHDNSTASTVQFQWSDADNVTDYIAYLVVDHQTLGELSWKQLLEYQTDLTSPWSGLEYLGSWPVASQYVVALFVTLVIAGAFSSVNVSVGLFSAVMSATIFVYIGWLSLTGNPQGDYLLLSIVGGYIVLNGIADARRRNR